MGNRETEGYKETNEGAYRRALITYSLIVLRFGQLARKVSTLSGQEELDSQRGDEYSPSISSLLGSKVSQSSV